MIKLNISFNYCSEEVFSCYHCNSLHHIDKIQKHPGDIVEAGPLAVSIAWLMHLMHTQAVTFFKQM
jgi:hypothetical protein